MIRAEFVVVGWALSSVTVLAACTQDYDTLGAGPGPGAGTGLPSGSGGIGTSVGPSSSEGAGASGGVGAGSTTSAMGGAGGSPTASSASSAGGGPVGPVVDCMIDAVTCAPGEVCCLEQGAPGNQMCKPAGGCGDWAVVSCDGPEDCAGGICCFHKTGDGGFDENYAIECLSECSGRNTFVICKAQEDCGGVVLCLDSPVHPGIKYCP